MVGLVMKAEMCFGQEITVFASAHRVAPLDPFRDARMLQLFFDARETA